MTKSEIVESINANTGIDRNDVLKVVEGVYLRGFGTFGLKTRKQKVARNISAKTAVIVPEHNIPSFKPSKEFMAMVKDIK